jgi:acyl carrier protein
MNVTVAGDHRVSGGRRAAQFLIRLAQLLEIPEDLRLTRNWPSLWADLEGETTDPGKPFRVQVEIDSMDLLNFVIPLHEAVDIEIPEKDYPKVQSLAGTVAYLRTFNEPGRVPRHSPALRFNSKCMHVQVHARGTASGAPYVRPSAGPAATILRHHMSTASAEWGIGISQTTGIGPTSCRVQSMRAAAR